MNGSRITLVLGLAGLAGLGLATPRILGTRETPEAAPVALPAPATPSACAPAAEPVQLEALEPACAASAVSATEVPAAQTASAALPQPIQAQAPRAGTLIQTAGQPVATRSVVSKPLAGAANPQVAAKQRMLLARKLASGQPAGSKVLPMAAGVQEKLALAGERTRDGAPQAPIASSGKAPLEKLPPPK